VQTATDTVGFVMEDIIREIRFGYTYHCGLPASGDEFGKTKDCTGGESYLAFEAGSDGDTENNNDQIVYQRIEIDGVGAIFKSEDSGTSFSRIISVSLMLLGCVSVLMQLRSRISDSAAFSIIRSAG